MICTCETVDVTGFDDVQRQIVEVSDPACPVHGTADVSTDVGKPAMAGARGETDTNARESGIVDDVSEPDWGCCDRPKPRIHEQTNRFFCGNCLLWLTGSNDKASGTTPNDADEGTVGQSPEVGDQE